MKNIPYEKRHAAETWQSSNGTFKTTQVGNLEMMFPAFSESKIFAICPDIVIIDKSDQELMLHLILGIKTLAKVGIVLDFQEFTIHIDHTIIVMRPYTSLVRKANMRVEAFQTEYIYMYLPVQVLLLGTTWSLLIRKKLLSIQYKY